MREAVSISRELFEGKTSNHEGRYYQMRNVKLGFEPLMTMGFANPVDIVSRED